MNSIILLLLVVAVYSEEMAITREYTDYLKRTVDWEVADYEENVFRGWTMDEVRAIVMHEETYSGKIEPLPPRKKRVMDPVPNSVLWNDTRCTPIDRIQGGGCESSWAFATALMLQQRFCVNDGQWDYGWVSVQELLSCDYRGFGCLGGFGFLATLYAEANRGLVVEQCYPYKNKEEDCPYSCVSNIGWNAFRFYNCEGPQYCATDTEMRECLATGPVTGIMEFHTPFLSYKKGIFSCNYRSPDLISLLLVGYSINPCYWIARNFWGKTWGEYGYVRIACNSCGIPNYYPVGNGMCWKVNVVR